MDKVQINEAVLQHWGIKGQKWGRRRYQNKDGSLTPEGRKRYGEWPDESGERKLTRKQRKEQAAKAAAEAKAKEEAETVEQKRERLLKSSDASELYKNRDLLSTAEINERLNRIDVERKLENAMKSAMPPKEKFSDKFTDKVEGALKVGRKINDVYEFATEKPVMKTLWKKLGLSKGEEDKSFNIKKLYENRDKMSDKDVQNAASRAENYNKLKKLYDDVTGDSEQSTDNALDVVNAYKNRDKLSNKEIQDVLNRADNYKKLENLYKDATGNSNGSGDDQTDSTQSKPADIKKLSESLAKKSEQIINKSNTDAKKEVQDALDKLPKSDALKKAAAVEVAKEVGPELGEVISAFNEGIMKANQKRLDEAKKNN